MKFLIDANLPYKLAILLKEKGFDVIHTDHLPEKEKTTDRVIREVSLREKRTVISKDSDFLDSHLITGVPEKFLYISTGNIINRELIVLIDRFIPQIVELFNNFDLIELTNDELIVHD